jgi:hypothetical protein
LGGQAAVIAAAATERGDPIPDDVTAAGDVWDHLRPYWNAFGELSAARSWAAGLAPIPLSIPYSERIAYVQYHFGPDDRADALYFIAAMDACWLTEWQRRNTK